MKILMLLALPLIGWGQFTTTISPQHGAIPEQYLGQKLPKGLVIALTNTCNAGPETASVYVDRIAQAVATVANVQDGAAAKFAAQAVKANSWKVLGLEALEGGLMFLPGFGFARAGTVVGKALAAAGGATMLAERVKDRRMQEAELNLPTNWWTPNPTLMTALAPGQCYSLLLALDGMPGKKEVDIGWRDTGLTSPVLQMAPVSQGVLSASAAPAEAIVSQSDPDPETEHFLLIESMIRANTERRELMERITGIGASN